MTKSKKEWLWKNLMVITFISILLTTSVTAGRAVYQWTPDSLSNPGVCYEWIWDKDENEQALIDYYFTLHYLTGWNIPIVNFIEEISPEDLCTMPPEMFEFYKQSQLPMFSDGMLTTLGDAGTWQFIDIYHVWISPEGDVYNGDRPPYQWLVWKGWEEYADHLPTPPEGAPFPAPPYSGIPKNTLPIAKIPPHTGNFYGPMECPFPDAIADPDPHSEWDWTDEMKIHLANLGLDTDMEKTWLGYEKSGTTIRMVGMTPSGTMREWILKRSKGVWTCDSASAEELEDMLIILERIDAISGTALATPSPTVTEKPTLTSLKNLNLNTLSTNTLKELNSSTMQKSLPLSGQSAAASISGRSEFLSQSGILTQQKSLVAAKTVQISPKVRRVIGST